MEITLYYKSALKHFDMLQYLIQHIFSLTKLNNTNKTYTFQNQEVESRIINYLGRHVTNCDKA